MKIVKNKHIGAYGIIIENNCIVLIKKACGGYTGKLDLPGGGMEHTELPTDTLKREIMEEAGMKVIDFKLLDVTSITFSWQVDKNIIEDLHHIGILYEVKATGKIKKDADGIDSLGANYYEINRLKKDDLTPFAIYSLEKLGYHLK